MSMRKRLMDTKSRLQGGQAEKVRAEEVYVDGAFMRLGIETIDPDPDQPRKYFDQEQLEKLTDSIRDKALLQPVVVRPGVGGRFILIAGERRYKAALSAGLKEVPAIVRTLGNPRELALIENLLRDDLLPLEKAEGLQRLMDEEGYTGRKLAQRLNMAESSISETLSLNRLPEEIKNALRTSEARRYPQRVLVEIARAGDQYEMNALFKSYGKNGLTVPQLRKKTKKRTVVKNRTSVGEINKRIAAFAKYITDAVAAGNIDQVFDHLIQLRDVLDDRLELAARQDLE